MISSITTVTEPVTIMKYSATILLFAAAVFWSSASARPHNPEQQGVIDAFTRWAIAEMEQLPEPHKSNLIHKLHEAQHKHWDNLMEYMVYVQNMMVNYVRQSGIDFSRRKRALGSDEEIDSDELLNSQIFYGLYARILILMAPESHQAALEKKYRKALMEEEYDSFDDFEMAAVKIFEDETGLNYEDLKAEYGADEGKRNELKDKFIAELVNALQGELDSSEED